MSALRDSLPPGVGEIPPLARLWATFVDPALEHAFTKENHELTVRRFVRLSVTASVVAFLAYGLHDALVIPSVRTTAWAIRYGVFGPIGALLVAYVFLHRKPRWHQEAMLLFGLGVNTVVIWIGAIAPPTGFFLYTSYAVVFVTLGPFLARMNVKMQVVYTALTLALYNGFDAALAHAPTPVRISLNLAILTLGTIGTIAAHQMEVQARLAFVARRIIREQMSALDAERTKSESLLLNVLPKRIADRLKGERGVIADHFPSATILFSDIVGFTELSSRLPPQEIVRRLDEVFTTFDDIAGELGLEKIKTIGDAYMVAGGIPVGRGDHVEAVCEMALRMREALTGVGDLRIRIGVHTGPVVAGVIGKKKFIYDVWGDTVNTASRMESHGLPGAIHVSEATYEAMKHLFYFEGRGEIEVKGKGAMKTFVLLRRREIEQREAALPAARAGT